MLQPLLRSITSYAHASIKKKDNGIGRQRTMTMKRLLRVTGALIPYTVDNGRLRAILETMGKVTCHRSVTIGATAPHPAVAEMTIVLATPGRCHQSDVLPKNIEDSGSL